MNDNDKLIENDSDNVDDDNNDDDSNDDSCIRSKIWMAPMVRGSELAFRTLVRLQGHLVTPCFSPMIRSEQVIKAYEYLQQQEEQEEGETFVSLTSSRDLHEDAILVLTDIRLDKEPLVVQLCGCHPDILYQASRILLDFNRRYGCRIVGLDLNLGCPQFCAEFGCFGAFLAERQPRSALDCVSAIRRAIDDDDDNADPYKNSTSRCAVGLRKPQLSCKIRLRDSPNETLQFAIQLREKGCEMLTVHCRRRLEKHDGTPDYEAGSQLVQALQHSMPILINGDVTSLQDAKRVLRQTQSSGVMIARGFLSNPLLLVNTTTISMGNPTPCYQTAVLSMAALYLDYVEQTPPPSSLYIRKHMQWLFRFHLRPSNSVFVDGFADDDWKARMWTFLQRPYLETIPQFRCLLGLYAKYLHQEQEYEGVDSRIPPSFQKYKFITFRDIRYGRFYDDDMEVEDKSFSGDCEGLSMGLFDRE